MENKKNNALEKAENIANGVDMLTPNMTDNPINSEVLLSKEQAKQRQREQLIERRKELKDKKRRVRARLREKRRQSRPNHGGWLAAVITLSVTTLVLASVLTATYLLPTKADTSLESSYRRAFLDTVTEVNNMDINLSKVLASNDDEAKSLHLVDLAINAELAERDLSELPLADESKFYTVKLINQIGDYAKSLNKKLTYGESLSVNDNQTLHVLYQNNLTLKKGLQNMLENMDKDYFFSSMEEGKKGDEIINIFNDLENLSVNYPQMIYDGPFSDGRQNVEVKGLTGNMINETEAQDIFIKHFGEYSPENVKTLSFSEGLIDCYNVSGEIDGQLAYAEITKQGGHLLMYSFAGSCEEVNYQDDFAREKAQEFLDGLGLKNMKPVWQNLANNVYIFNFAYEDDGIIYYPDLVKVRVCAQTNMVIGFEGVGYYTNHTQRQTEKPTEDLVSAKNKIKKEIEIESYRLCVIPIGSSSEMLCYEFSGVMDDSTYYVYIDAKTGRQAQLFKVVNSTEGTLLM